MPGALAEGHGGMEHEAWDGLEGVKGMGVAW